MPTKDIETIWDKVSKKDKDFFFTFLEKKVRAPHKKLKEIERLESMSTLRPEQIGKV